MKITFDSNKQRETLAARGLDFADAAEVFLGRTLEVTDDRRDYGELRLICYGYLRARLVVIVYTLRGSSRHVISMRKANAREEAFVASVLEV